MQLKPQEVAVWREDFRKSQKNKCPLCGKFVAKKDAALDHCHDHGHIRGTLHKNCNSIEGRVKHWARRSGVTPVLFLRSLIAYWSQDYTENPIHPNHRSEVQKDVLTLKRRMRRAKRPSTKAKLKQQIQELLDEQI